VQFLNQQFLESADFPFGCTWFEHRPGLATNKHSHEFIELVYVCKGEAVHHYNDIRYPVAKGDVFIIPKGVEHYYHVSDKQPLLLCNVHFLTELLAAELKQMSKVTSFVNFFYLEPFLRESANFESHLTLHEQERKELERLLNVLSRESTEKRLGYQIKIKAQLIDCMVFLSRCYYDQTEGQKPKASSEEDRIRMICHFIEHHFNENFSFEQLCALTHMSKTKFSTLFKQHTGMTMVEFRNCCRMEHDKKMLRDPHLSIVRISQHIGFQDACYPSGAFCDTSFSCTLRMSSGQQIKPTGLHRTVLREYHAA
jgi:AraC-like DNA-binding protein/mannose-6-phosphate isomerase-like protein (cupin superfamily)